MNVVAAVSSQESLEVFGENCARKSEGSRVVSLGRHFRVVVQLLGDWRSEPRRSALQQLARTACQDEYRGRVMD